MATEKKNDDDLFPVPCAPPSKSIPRVWPGVSPETTTALREVLKDNHKKWHIFFNDQGFHNHIAHRAIAIWALGAPGDVIKAGYKLDSEYQRPIPESPGRITLENFQQHLGDKNYYPAYLAFFTENIRDQGVAAAVEQCIFTKEFNLNPGGRKPDMLGRFLGGLFHPMIHTGYGLEFCLPGMVAEGLAQAATHSDDSSAHIPESFFDNHKSGHPVQDALSRLKSLVVSEASVTTPSSAQRVHAFTILARILQDPELGDVKDPEDKGMFTATVTKHGTAIAKHMQDWHVDATDRRDVERRIEELSWMNSLIYAVGGSQKGHPFNADFFLLHMVTSSLFLPSQIVFLTPSSQALLLRSYLFTSLGWWISRGRPNFDVQKFYQTTDLHPLPPGRSPHPHKDALLSEDPRASAPNPWLDIIQNALIHPDDHIAKIQRAFLHYATLYGLRQPEQADFKNTELKGAERLDGTLFIRAAALTEEKLGRVKEGEEPAHWDHDGFYHSKD